jgi:hypothetical protein
MSQLMQIHLTPTRPITPSIPEPVIQKRCETLELFFPIIKTSHDRIREFLDYVLVAVRNPLQVGPNLEVCVQDELKKKRRRRARVCRLVGKDGKRGILARITCQ